MPRYKTIDKRRVSSAWWCLLRDIRKLDKVSFKVNSGHRTLRQQWRLWKLYKSGQGPIAAYPLPSAPHIRTGRSDHAVDFGNSEGVRKAAAKRGVTLTRTVRWPDGSVREDWHLEANRKELLAYYRSWKKAHGTGK